MCLKSKMLLASVIIKRLVEKGGEQGDGVASPMVMETDCRSSGFSAPPVDIALLRLRQGTLRPRFV